MDKKHLIVVSIVAVVLLVIGSLNNVVGYQSVKSTVNDSPLFQTRTERASNQQQNGINSQYIGRGKENLLQFPIRDDRIERLKKVIDIISKMDDKTFGQFTELCIKKTRQDDTLRDISRYQIIQSLLLLKTKPEAIMYFFTNGNNQGDTIFPTYCGSTFCGDWPPGCLIIGIVYLIICSPIIILLVILDSLTISGSYYCENPS